MPIALDAIKPVKSLLGLLPWLGGGRGSSEDIDDKIQAVLLRLSELEDRLAEMRVKFERRITELFSKTVYELKRGERRRAEIYAQEVAHLRNFLKLIKTTERLLIQMTERLKTVRDARELTEILLTFGAAIDEVRSQIQGIYPGLALAFEEINRNIRAILVETAPPTITEIDTASIAEEATKVLEEAAKHAETEVEKLVPSDAMRKILGDKLEEIEKVMQLIRSEKRRAEKEQQASSGGVTQSAQQAGRAAARPERPQRRVSVPAAGAVRVAGAPRAERQQPRRRLTPEELEMKLLAYIMERGGFLDINDFARRYNVTREEILAALQRLSAKGYIRLA